jgi:hypothetical protein
MSQVRARNEMAGQAVVPDLENGLFDGVRGHVEAMVSWARSQEALGLDHDQFESRTVEDGWEMMRLFAEAHMAVRTMRERRRDDVIDAAGNRHGSVETGQEHTRIMVFGAVRTVRMSYGHHREPNLYPQDAELNWGTGHSFSAGVERRTARASAVVPFGPAAAQVSAATAITLGKRQAEELAIGSVTDFEAYYAARLPGPCPAGTGLLVTGDGSALTVLPAALRPATAKAAKARAAAAGGWPEDPADLRKSTRRSAELVCVADIPPRPRTRDDILTALFGTVPGPAGPAAGRDDPAAGQPPARHGPRAEGKTLFASVKKPIPEVISEGFAEASRRDPGRLRPWFAVVDGNNAQIDAINKLAAEYQVKVPVLIDVIHVTQYLWKAAGSFYDKGDPAARSWVREQAAKILDGKARDVKSGIRRRATWAGYSTAERAGADACAGYLENKMDYLDYPAFLAAGWPVASGLIEGAARWLVKDRMEVTGARWGLDGAEAVLKLRALVGNGDFDDYFTFHLEQEKRRNHDSRYCNAMTLAA